MAVKLIAATKSYVGLSSDTKPVDLPVGSTFFEYDTQTYSIYVNDRLNFDAQTGSFTANNFIIGATSGAVAQIIDVIDSGTTGTLYLKIITGTFQDNEIIYESALGSELVANGTDWTGGPPPTGWTVIGGSCTLAAIAGGQAGNCLELTRVGGASQSAWYPITTGIANFFILTAYVKSGTSGNEIFTIRAYNDALNIELGVAQATTSGSWVQFPVYFESITATSLVVLYKTSATAGTMLFDTVSSKQLTNAALANGTVY